MTNQQLFLFSSNQLDTAYFLLEEINKKILTKYPNIEKSKKFSFSTGEKEVNKVEFLAPLYKFIKEEQEKLQILLQ